MGKTRKNGILTVRGLMAKLAKCDQDAMVVVPHDEEGNGFDGVFAVSKSDKKEAEEYETAFVCLETTIDPVLW